MTGPLTRLLLPYARTTSALVAVAALAVTTACSGGEPERQSPPLGASVDAVGESAAPGASATTPSDPSRPSEPSADTESGNRPLGSLPTDEEGRLLGQFVNFAVRPSNDIAPQVGFAPEVELGLGDEVRRTISASDLGNPRRWMLPTEGAFGQSGFLSALDAITAQAERAIEAELETSIFAVSAGPHRACQSAPAEVLDGYSVNRQISVLPGQGSITGCAEWFAVDLYVDDDGQIAAVSLDLVEP